jgi:hypothetical protein
MKMDKLSNQNKFILEINKVLEYFKKPLALCNDPNECTHGYLTKNNNITNLQICIEGIDHYNIEILSMDEKTIRKYAKNNNRFRWNLTNL